MSGSLFALFTYIVLYLQNILGLSAIETGVRFLALSGAIFVMAAIAGRLSERVPTRYLIGPGFVLVGTGILLMRGIEPTDSWTHLLPGFIVSGAGAGLINVPLANTAVAVVEPARAGMASGINSTFRQVGLATGIAALGSIFASSMRDTITGALSATPVAGRADALATEISAGGASQAIASVPASMRDTVGQTANAAFIDGLNDILLIGAVLAFAAALASFALIRQRDYYVHPAQEAEPQALGAQHAPEPA
jgi:predicted MFS family arabinose efflux permease